FWLAARDLHHQGRGALAHRRIHGEVPGSIYRHDASLWNGRHPWTRPHCWAAVSGRMNRLGNAILTTGLTGGERSRFVHRDGGTARSLSVGELLTKQDLETALETFALRLTMRLGTRHVIAIADVAT